MEFDVIPITATDLKKLGTAKLKLLRDAQLKKNALLLSAERELKDFELAVMSAGMKYSSLLESKQRELDNEVEYRCAVIADNLLFDMSVVDSDEEGGGGSASGGENENPGYRVDYSLSYNERYIIVRDYYLKFSDIDERIALYSADEVAKSYLGSYYQTLYNFLATYKTN